MGGLFHGYPVIEPWHAPALIASNVTAVPLSATPLWVHFVFVQPVDANPGLALFGDLNLSPTSFGFSIIPGDMVMLPFPSPLPLHKTYYYQLGGAGTCAVFAGRFVNEQMG